MKQDPRLLENKGPVSLADILGWCLREYKVDTLLVTSRPSVSRKGALVFEPEIDASVKRIFGKNLVGRFDATGWPGTELTRHAGRVYVIRFGEGVLNRMVQVEADLFSWVHSPNRLPEDICVFKAGTRFPVLMTVTHEEDAFVIDRKGRCPAGFEESDLRPEDWYIWNGPYFCRPVAGGQVNVGGGPGKQP